MKNQTLVNFAFFAFYIFFNQSVLAQVPNDICSGATTLSIGVTCDGITPNGDNNNAVDEGNGGSCFYSPNKDVWYSFIAPPEGKVNIKLDYDYSYTGSNEIKGEMALYSGSCGSLVEEACGEYSFGTATTIAGTSVESGVTYYIQVSGDTGDEGSFCIQVYEPLVNDICSGATALSLGETCDGITPNGDNFNAGDEGNDGSCFSWNSNNKDVWYSFVAPAGGLVNIELDYANSYTGSNEINGEMALYSGSCGNLIEEACEDYSSFNTSTSIIGSILVSGNTYYIQVSGDTGDEGAFCIQVYEPEPLVNDICSGATALSLGVTCDGITPNGDNYSATDEGNSGSCFDSPNRDLWYSFVAPVGGVVNIKLDYANSYTGTDEINGEMALYSGSCGSLVEEDCAGYSFGATSIEGISVISGATYYIQVSGDNGDVGTFCIQVSEPLINDICSGATVLSLGVTCDGITPNGDNYSATDEGNGASCFDSPNRDVWYSFIAPAGGMVNIKLDYANSYTGSDEIDGELALYSGSCGNLVEENCEVYSFGGPTTIAGISLVTGDTYYIQVSGDNGDEGAFCIQVSEPLVNDICSGATALILGVTCDGEITNGDNNNAADEANGASCFDSPNRDVWYSFVAPAGGLVNINLDYTLSFSGLEKIRGELALYSGSCGNLVEENCGVYSFSSATTLGGISVISGDTYYIQISGDNGDDGAFCIEVYEPLINDICSGATPILFGENCDGVTTNGTNLNAADEGNGASCFINTNRDVWFSFVAPTGGFVNIELNYGFDLTGLDGIYGDMAIYSGSCGSLVEEACELWLNSSSESSSLGGISVLPGDTYYIQVSGYNENDGTFCIQVTEPLVNDICSGATALSLGVTCDGITPNGNNYNSGDEGNGSSCVFSPNRDVWYSFVAPAGGLVNIELDYDDSYTGTDEIYGELALYSGICGSLVEESCGFDNQFTSFSNVAVLPGNTYYIQVSGNTGDVGTFCIQVYEPLVNDICSGATDLSIGVACDGITPNGNNYAAGDEGNGGSCVFGPNKDVWYSFVAPVGGLVNIKLDFDNSYTGTDEILGELALYSGSCGNLIEENCEGYSGESKLFGGISVLTGDTYYLQVSGSGGDEGVFCIQVSEPLINDICSGATTLIIGETCDGITPNGDNYNSGDEGNDGSCFLSTNIFNSSSSNRDVWYNFVAPAGGIVNIRLDYDESYTGSDEINGQMALYSGSCGSLVEEICGVDPNSSSITFEGMGVVPGDTYFIQVSGAYRDEGTFCIEVYLPLVNDICSGAIPILFGENCDIDVGNGSNKNAIDENNIVSSCLNSPSKDVWYSYTAQATEQVNIKLRRATGFVLNRFFEVEFAVYTGSCGNLQELNCSSSESSIPFDGFRLGIETTIGETYYIRVAGYDEYNYGAFCIEVVESSINNLCQHAIPISLGKNCDGSFSNVNMVNSGAENIYSLSCIDSITIKNNYGIIGHDIWYSFTTTIGGDFNIGLRPLDSGGGGFMVYKGQCGNLEEISCVFHENQISQTQLQNGSIRLLAGETILIRVITNNDDPYCLEVFESLTNDICDNAIPIDTGYTQLGNLFDAGDEGDIPFSYKLSLRNDVWYSFISPLTGSINIVSSSGIPSFYSGDCNSLTEIAYGSNIGVTVVQGNNYLIRFEQFGDWDTNTIADIRISEPLINDICDGAIPLAIGIACDGTTTNGTNKNAADEGTPPASCFQYNTSFSLSKEIKEPDYINKNDVWYSFVAPPSGRVNIRLDYRDSYYEDDPNNNYGKIDKFIGELSLYNGSCSNLQELACKSHYIGNPINVGLRNSNGKQHIITQDVIPGELYFIRVSHLPLYYQGNFCIQVSEPLENEICSDALPLTIGADCNDPNAIGDLNNAAIDTTNTSSGALDLWYSFVAPPEGKVNIKLTPEYRGGNPRYYLYSSCSPYLSEGFAQGTYYRGVSLTSLKPSGSTGSTESTEEANSTIIKKTWDVIPGNTYYIRVTGGGFPFCLQVSVPLPNDICSGAIDIPFGTYCDGNNTSGDNVGSGIEPWSILNEDIQTCNRYNYTRRSDVWYSFLAPSTNRVSVYFNSESPFTIDSYEGTCDSLFLMDCSDYLNLNDFCSSHLILDVIEGEKYYLRVASGDIDEQNEGAFCIDIVPLEPNNNTCNSANRLALNTCCELNYIGEGANVSYSNAVEESTVPVPSCSNFSDNLDVWYYFVSPYTSYTQVNYEITSNDVFEATFYSSTSECDSLVEIDCGVMDGSVLTQSSLSIIQLPPGDTCFVRLNNGSSEGSLCLTLETLTEPAPSNFTLRAILSDLAPISTQSSVSIDLDSTGLLTVSEDIIEYNLGETSTVGDTLISLDTIVNECSVMLNVGQMSQLWREIKEEQNFFSLEENNRSRYGASSHQTIMHWQVGGDTLNHRVSQRDTMLAPIANIVIFLNSLIPDSCTIIVPAVPTKQPFSIEADYCDLPITNPPIDMLHPLSVAGQQLEIEHAVKQNVITNIQGDSNYPNALKFCVNNLPQATSTLFAEESFNNLSSTGTECPNSIVKLFIRFHVRLFLERPEGHPDYLSPSDMAAREENRKRKKEVKRKIVNAIIAGWTDKRCGEGRYLKNLKIEYEIVPLFNKIAPDVGFACSLESGFDFGKGYHEILIPSSFGAVEDNIKNCLSLYESGTTEAELFNTMLAYGNRPFVKRFVKENASELWDVFPWANDDKYDSMINSGRTTWGAWSFNHPSWIYAHEAGHLMNLNDQYISIKKAAARNKKPNEPNFELDDGIFLESDLYHRCFEGICNDGNGNPFTEFDVLNVLDFNNLIYPGRKKDWNDNDQFTVYRSDDDLMACLNDLNGPANGRYCPTSVDIDKILGNCGSSQFQSSITGQPNRLVTFPVGSIFMSRDGLNARITTREHDLFLPKDSTEQFTFQDSFELFFQTLPLYSTDTSDYVGKTFDVLPPLNTWQGFSGADSLLAALEYNAQGALACADGLVDSVLIVTDDASLDFPILTNPISNSNGESDLVFPCELFALDNTSLQDETIDQDQLLTKNWNWKNHIEVRGYIDTVRWVVISSPAGSNPTLGAQPNYQLDFSADSAGVYQIGYYFEVYDTLGYNSSSVCDTIFGFDVTVGNNCVQAGFEVVQNNNVITFQNFTTGGVDYLWNFDNGASSTIFEPNITFTENGTYNICLTSSNTCGSDEVCQEVVIDCIQQYFEDIDGDGYGNPNISVMDCSPLGFVLNDSDCDDGNINVYNGAPELCDDIDNNCNGLGDEPYITYYLDSDDDGFGDLNESIEACSLPVGYVENDQDCDDTNENVNTQSDCSHCNDGVINGDETGIDCGGILCDPCSSVVVNFPTNNQPNLNIPSQSKTPFPFTGGNNDIELLQSMDIEQIKNQFTPKDLFLNVFPNPFNETATIDYFLPTESRINLSLYDINGNFIKYLDKREDSIGWNKVELNSQDMAGGVYLLLLQTTDDVMYQKVVIYR